MRASWPTTSPLTAQQLASLRHRVEVWERRGSSVPAGQYVRDMKKLLAAYDRLSREASRALDDARQGDLFAEEVRA